MSRGPNIVPIGRFPELDATPGSSDLNETLAAIAKG